MASKDDFFINFSGITHDHALLDPPQQEDATTAVTNNQDCSTIAILRRHPMYDCLVLVKKYRDCLGDYSLEFPSGGLTTEESSMMSADEETTTPDEDTTSGNSQKQQQNLSGSNCGRRKLISRFLDGDDPMYQSCCATHANCFENGSSTTCGAVPQQPLPLEPQSDDKGDNCELVHVPINGLLDRLKNYTKSGLAVDSRVYSFAMGLKTAERILTTNSMKELQETPI